MKSAGFEQYSGVSALVIDMQPTYLDLIRLPERTALIESQLEMLNIFAEERIPVMAIEYVGREKTSEFLRPAIEAVPQHKYLEKVADDGFDRTSLTELLLDWHTERLVIMGVLASCCVLTTAQSAVENGFEIYVARQLIADTQKLEYDRDGLDWLRTNGVFTEDYLGLIDILKNGKVQ